MSFIWWFNDFYYGTSTTIEVVVTKFDANCHYPQKINPNYFRMNKVMFDFLTFSTKATLGINMWSF